MIPFNKLHTTGGELEMISRAVGSGELSGDGEYTRLCESFFEQKYGFGKALLTPSCTDALEMAALLIDTRPGDEIILPAYGFVSTANAFLLRGAKLVFVDSEATGPNMDPEAAAAAVGPATKAIVVVHYAGAACKIKAFQELAKKNNLYLIEDAAQAIDSFYEGRPLGSFGEIAAFSFHGTKNIVSGEGGLLVVNDRKFSKRAEVIREKGTDRSAFLRKKTSTYRWLDLGSSFLVSEITAAFLYAQLTALDDIQRRRRYLWALYEQAFGGLDLNRFFALPVLNPGSNHNGHIFYLVFKRAKDREAYMAFMQENGVEVKAHYITLHDSPYFKSLWSGPALRRAKAFQHRLVRLPLFYELREEDIARIAGLTQIFCQSLKR